MDTKKRNWLIVIGIVEVLVIIFSLVVSIIVLVRPMSTSQPDANIANNGPFIGWLQNNPIWFFFCFVAPLFIIFAVDGVYLIVFATKKESALSDKERDAIQEEARRQAREEVMKQIKDQQKAPSETKDKK